MVVAHGQCGNYRIQGHIPGTELVCLCQLLSPPGAEATLSFVFPLPKLPHEAALSVELMSSQGTFEP